MSTLDRRTFLRIVGVGGVGAAFIPSFANATGLPAAQTEFDLVIAEERLPIADGMGRVITVNGTCPGPTLHWREGDEVTIRVQNTLRETSSIHWHGILLPFRMDGVPGVSFDGIPPGETFTYRFRVSQTGTYWYHSHSGLQEQRGLVGSIVISPREAPTVAVREHVIVLTDWTFMRPKRVMAILKKRSGYFNYQKRTVVDALTARDGMALKTTLLWGRMRMEPSDIADVTGSTYHFLLNGRSTTDPWTGLFTPGERVRLRIINASAMTHFDVRIPGLPMTVIEADGQPVQPIETDELRIAVAETYDVVVEPGHERAYTVFAETMDRSGHAVGTLAVEEGIHAPIPERRARPLLTMADMGMAMTGMDDGEMAGMDHTEMAGMDDGEMAGMDHTEMAGMDHSEAPQAHPLGPPDLAALGPVAPHAPGHHGVRSLTAAAQPRILVDQPGPGLRDMPWRVLVYSDLAAHRPWLSSRVPDREIELHLTGHMERYIWSINGRTFAQDPYIHVRYGELVRLVFTNDTMMSHPMHLHGMWMHLENGRGELIPRKHTIDVRPAERVTALVHVDAPGDWAFHCHLLYHMDQGMFRIVRVDGTSDDGSPS